MITPEEAWRRIAKEVEPLEVVERNRVEAGGFVIGRALEARVNVPATDVSAMDGYALAGDAGADGDFEVVGIIAAGDSPGFELPPDRAVRIMTGATVPENADRVVPIEETNGGVDHVVVSSDPGPGRHIRRQGEVLRSGRPLLERGALLTPGALGLLATHGFAKVPVVSEPSVAILTTGDEVVSPETTPAPGQLRDSHTDFLSAAARATTSNVTPLGIVEDDAVAIAERVEEGLLADVLLVSGGVSMGEFDLVEGVLREAGCDFLFDSVSIQPGKPLVVARHEGGLVFGLPGNPASAMVCFWLFVRPALRRLRGLRDEFWQGALSARSLEPLPGSRGRDLFLPAEVRFEQGEPLARTVPPRGSHDLAAYARGTALARIPASSEPAPAGSRCEVLPLENWTATAQP